MDYEKKYKEAQKWIESIYPNLSHEQQMEAEAFFPELKESEDEKIRKFLIKWIQDNYYHGTTEIPTKTLIAWLEKQNHNVDNTNKEYWRGYREGKQEVLDKYAELEKQGEQPKPSIRERYKRIANSEWFKKTHEGMSVSDDEKVDNVNKIEPKFKVGDWVVFDGETLHITNVTENGYSTEDGAIPFRCEKETKPWTIADAKNGDVLTCNEEILLFKSYSVQNRISLYCWYNGRTNNFHSKEVDDTLLTTRNKICPATKEQRDTLFAKMKEAGYEWDVEKKQLNRIEQKPVDKVDQHSLPVSDDSSLPTFDESIYHPCTEEVYEQKSAWSEEDENRINRLIAYFEDKESFTAEDDIAYANWLKSIRPQKQWKPTKEQMDALLFVVQHYTPKVTDKIAWDSLKTLELMYYEIKQ